MQTMRSGITKFVIASLLAVPGLSLAQSKGSHGAFATAAKKKLIRDFKDPSTAQFRDVFVATMGKDHIALCGEVNAKNSYGAYIGFKPFYVIQEKGQPIGTPTIAPEVGDLVFQTIFGAYCSDKVQDIP